MADLRTWPSPPCRFKSFRLCHRLPNHYAERFPAERYLPVATALDSVVCCEFGNKFEAVGFDVYANVIGEPASRRNNNTFPLDLGREALLDEVVCWC